MSDSDLILSGGRWKAAETTVKLDAPVLIKWMRGLGSEETEFSAMISRADCRAIADIVEELSRDYQG